MRRGGKAGVGSRVVTSLEEAEEVLGLVPGGFGGIG